MNIAKNLLARIFAFWALLIFAATLLIIIVPTWLSGLWPEPKRSRILHPANQAWMKIFFTLSGVRRIYKGRQHFKKGEAYVVICNHNSFMDPPLSTPGIPYANKTIAKSEMARIPIFGVIYKRGSVLVDRKKEESRKQSYVKMKEVLNLGLHMCIYPEGTRNKTSEPLQRFHDGAFKLAVDTGRPIIPALLFNTKIVLPPGRGFYFWPHTVEMHFLHPIPVDNKTPYQLKEEAFHIMKEYYVSNSKHRS